MTTFNGPANGGVTELLDISLRYIITDQTIGVMREIGAFEAKSELGQLLDLVEAGEEVTITRRRHHKTLTSTAPRMLSRTRVKSGLGSEVCRRG